MSRERSNSLFIVAFFVWIIFDIFAVTTLPIKFLAITSTEWTCYAAIFIAGYAYSKQTEWDRRLFPFYRGLILFSLLYVILHIARGEYTDSSALTAILLSLAFLVAVTHMNITIKHIVSFAYISLFVTALLFIHWIMLDHPMAGFQSYIRNPNILGVLASCLLFFMLIGFKYVNRWQRSLFIIGMLINLLFVYASSARAVLMLLATVIAAKVVLSLSRKLFSYLFYIVMAFNAVFLLMYGALAKLHSFTKLNEWSIETFGKGIFSGRQVIWGPALEYGGQNPLFGHQIGVMPSDYIKDTFLVHAHNQYLQIFLESGIVGLICFLLLLFGIWKVYQKGLDHTIVRWSACFFLGILVYQSVEISFFRNMEPIGLLHWMIIGLGINAVYWSRSAPAPTIEIDEVELTETKIMKRRPGRGRTIR